MERSIYAGVKTAKKQVIGGVRSMRNRHGTCGRLAHLLGDLYYACVRAREWPKTAKNAKK